MTDSAPSLDPQKFDIVILADMACRGDAGLRIAQDIHALAWADYRLGLIHLPSSRPAEVATPDIAAVVRMGLAEAVSADLPVRARLALVYLPDQPAEPPEQVRRLKADRVVLIHDRPPQAKDIGRWFGFLVGPMSWAPTCPAVRKALQGLRLPVPIEPEDWRPTAPERSDYGARRNRSAPVVGLAFAGGEPADPGLAELLAENGALDVCILGRSQEADRKRRSESWTRLDRGDATVKRWIGLLDALVVVAPDAAAVLPSATVAAALAAGKPVFLPERLSEAAAGTIGYPPDALKEKLTELFADAGALQAMRRAASERAATEFSAEVFLKQRAALLPPRATRKPRQKQTERRALFVSSNGVGLGHVTRLLAVARRMTDPVVPVFATMAQAAPIVESFGYTAEYIPSQSDTGVEPESWDAWFRVEFERLIEKYDAELVVFDGNNPTHGLVRAALSHGGCRLAWIRRGMGRPTASRYLDNARFFDLIIEPGELAGERDQGPTAQRRHEAKLVPPIRLLDESELLPRQEAARVLGLDPAQPAVLLHLGAGSNRDILAIVDSVAKKLRQFSGVQVVVAEWANGRMPLSLWPDIHVLRGFPISRYFNAFDFSIGAAGYNSFHEVVFFELPTIFIADTHPSLDDQAARARYAQDIGAGLDLPEDQIFHLPAICEVLLDPRARKVVRENCRRAHQENGAAVAARALHELMGSP